MNRPQARAIKRCILLHLCLKFPCGLKLTTSIYTGARLSWLTQVQSYDYFLTNNSSIADDLKIDFIFTPQMCSDAGKGVSA